MASLAGPNPCNGETAEQIKHALELKASKQDHSQDQECEVDASLGCTDLYCLITSYIWLAIKGLLFALPLLVASFPVVVVTKCFGSSLPPKTESLTSRRSLSVLCLPFLVVYILLALIVYLSDCTMYYIFGLPWFLGRSLTCQVRYQASWEVIRPHHSGPFVLFHLTDALVALVGQVQRHGVLEATGQLAFMIIIVPWCKYYINTNPLLYNLEERFVQQISTSLQDLPIDRVTLASRQLISRCRQADDLQNRVDQWPFVPHYPYPPPGRHYALGMQAGAGGKPYGFYLLVHTTHALELGTTELRDRNYLTVSNSAQLPVYRVMLWYNNPYHLYTGYVEASISSGEPSQPEKRHGGEHPMWLVVPRSPLQLDRAASFGVSMIDAFFDRWLPFYVDEMRRLLVGDEYAKKMSEGVVSKHGISRPAGGKEVVHLSATLKDP
ncbi:unnamed protein product [Symbiodinium natans]|uniref:Uncharacterized protein n=1 Tax=Symbiodinium natans TaxID=878477 RepID=A0A812SRB9_9DINO|nr:unnamed protein product [Symbiodinium natans]